MDRKQREDAINEVRHGANMAAAGLFLLASESWMFKCSVSTLGACFKGHEASLHHYIQGVFHGQALSLHRHGFR